MAFALAGLALISQEIGGKHRRYEYRTTDSLATVLGSGYFTTASKKGITTGDEIIVIKTDDSPPVPYRTRVSTITSDAATVVFNAATQYEGFYGATPIVQRAGAAQATSLLSTASSTAIDTATKAALIEVMNTLAALGLWKGAA